MDSLKQRIEKKAVRGIRQQVPLEQRMQLIDFDEPMIEVSVVLKLLADYKKQLEDLYVSFPEKPKGVREFDDPAIEMWILEVLTWKKRMKELLGDSK